MKIKRIIKTILTLITILLITANFNIVQAQEREDITIEDVTGGANNFIHSGTTQNNPLDITGVQNVTDVLYNILLAVGIIVAVIVGLLIGIKYIPSIVA